MTLVADLRILYVYSECTQTGVGYVPEVLDQEVEKIKQKYEPLLKDPVNTIGGIGQSICDTADEKGVAYSSGYIVTEVVTALLADKGLDKIKNVVKTGKTADNVADIAEGAAKGAGNAAEDAGKAGKKLDGAAEDAGKVGESGSVTKISLPENDAQLKHIFREGNGHIIDTPDNRSKILNVANDKKNYLGRDARGNDWYAKTESDGSQIWVRTRNGKVDNAGVNTTPRTWDDETGLYNNTRR